MTVVVFRGGWREGNEACVLITREGSEESYSEGEGSRGKLMRVVVLRGSTEILCRWPQRIISFRSNGVSSEKIQEGAIRISQG